MEIFNGLIPFTLFLIGKFNSKVDHFESQTASWNGLCSTFEGPLFMNVCCLKVKAVFMIARWHVMTTSEVLLHDHLLDNVQCAGF